MFGYFGLLLEVLRLGLERLVDEFDLDMVALVMATIQQETQHVFCVQVGHYRAWIAKFDDEPLDCYYADDMEVLWT